MRRLAIFTTLFSTTLLLASPSHARKPPDVTHAEMALLPPYCPDTMGFGYGDAYHNTSPNAPKWVALMGNDFWHMHHHCWALINIRRAESARLPTSEKVRLRKEALSDFRYVVNNARRDFVLLPEIYTWIGRTELQLRNEKAAGEAFAHARILKPDYAPAYTHLAEFLIGQGNRKEALKVVMEGLENAPQAKGLQQLYRELGGKSENLPKPKPTTEKNPLVGESTDSSAQTDSPSPTAAELPRKPD